ncbi:hypothetical protein BLEM_1348 [Bifidobacterium lemurum]|uniref:Uncharacterized protein n=1 Tax=Bifidobacterium lemurum TaxID=1603886 RepID=A0A261FRK0_9BIFI|nr:HTH domain-containing protein [Bifidobacterium lemurum]OZG61811.1 hypothetical protein BLEM_1348 [Bifidobacterium lemurum]QOL34957.1 hypothetical protein BL8807_03475 [Bifidobacterium lemurum]
MARQSFSSRTRKALQSLDAVASVSETRITYSEDFRDECMRRYAQGESPTAIFREAGLDPKVIGYKRIERCISRWRDKTAQ